MKRLAATILSLAVFQNTASADAISDIYTRQVTQLVNNSAATKAMSALGFRDDNLHTGYIVDNPGNNFEVRYTLHRGTAYAFVGVCDEDCTDVDLTLIGPNGETIAEDRLADDNPSIWVFIKNDGQYRVRATLAKCNAPIGCYVAIKEMYK